ncbi:MAG: pyridoxamine 5'-phosphate oxidase family protein [Chloroflexi bacterium]|nr:pyridoxamine 5'-phosphate oxidase family protein [Chloroflexota bacterium]
MMYEMSADTLREMLGQRSTAVLATVRRDGSPYTIPLWFLWQGEVPDDVDPAGNPPSGHVWFSGRTTSTWAKHLQRDARASLCIDVEGPPAMHIGLDGPVECLTEEEFDHAPLMRRVVEKYVGRGDPANDEMVERYLEMTGSITQLHFKLTPTRWRAIDLSSFDPR